MGIVRDMEEMKIDRKDVENSFKELEEASKSPDWERWDRLKLSAYHGRKLVKRNFQPTDPGGERFMLHDLDSLGFNTETKLFILVQTFKRLFGNGAASDSSKGKKHGTKLTFLREKGKRYFNEGKKITDLIDFPQAYWDALEALEKAKEEKPLKRTSESTSDNSTKSEKQNHNAVPQRKRLRSEKLQNSKS